MLENKIAIITGGAGMIGRCIAENMIAEGAKVALADINAEALKNVTDKLNADGCEHAIGIPLNIKNYNEVEAAVDETTAHFGRVDILVGAAGGSPRARRKFFYEQDIEVIEDNIGVNLFGNIYFSKAVANRMIAQNEGGRIILFGSVLGVNGHKKSAEYSAAKGGVIAFTKSAAKELGSFGITVNTVSPGIIPHDDKDYSKTNYLGITPNSEDVAGIVVFLASQKARFITGQNIIVDGGRGLATLGTDI